MVACQVLPEHYGNFYSTPEQETQPLCTDEGERHIGSESPCEPAEPQRHVEAQMNVSFMLLGRLCKLMFC